MRVRQDMACGGGTRQEIRVSTITGSALYTGIPRPRSFDRLKATVSSSPSRRDWFAHGCLAGGELSLSSRRSRARRLAVKLNDYVIELWHEPGISPLGNAAYRKMSQRTHNALPSLMEKRGMKAVGAYHLDPEHRAILIWQAKSVEDVRDVLYEAGFM